MHIIFFNTFAALDREIHAKIQKSKKICTNFMHTHWVHYMGQSQQVMRQMWLPIWSTLWQFLGLNSSAPWNIILRHNPGFPEGLCYWHVQPLKSLFLTTAVKFVPFYCPFPCLISPSFSCFHFFLPTVPVFLLRIRDDLELIKSRGLWSWIAGLRPFHFCWGAGWYFFVMWTIACNSATDAVQRTNLVCIFPIDKHSLLLRRQSCLDRKSVV